MPDEIIISDYSPDVPRFRLTREGDYTIIRDYSTNAPRFKFEGEIGGSGVEVMTTAERTAITPDEGKLIYDSELEALYVGDGVTAGGIPVGSGGGGGGGTPATITDIMTGSGASKILNVSNIRGALTAGQAVDVTSQPDGVTGDYRGTFSVTGSLGFASFPKYASGLNYLMIADLTATTSGTVTPSGTWLDGTTTAKSLAAGTLTRVAMTFNAANKAKFTFASTGSVSVSHCREYEVTACSVEAVAYIAALSNPDAFTAYYLVKSDMVQPWTYIIDMGSSPAVTIASGLSYKLNATGTHQLTVDTCPAGYDGRDAIIRIRLGGSGVIHAVAPLQLGGALVPYAINNCVVRYRDGEAVLLVEDTLAGYVVTVNSGTGDGSLPYGLASVGVPYIAFSPSTDGIPVELSGATTAAEEVTVVGNGYEDTILTGSINCTSKTIVANIALSDVQVMGGTMTFGDVFIPSGSTVAVSGGSLAVERVSGNGGVIDLGKTRIIETNGMVMSGVTITNGYSNAAGGAVNVGNKKADFISCVFSGNSCSGTGGAISTYAAANARFVSCTITGNTSGNGSGLFCDQGVFSGCTISGNLGGSGDIRFTSSSAVVSATDCTFGGAYTSRGKLYLTGSNHFDLIAGASATVYIAEGAIVDMTGASAATVVNPGGGITLYGGSQTNHTKIYGSEGSATQLREFGAKATITGSAITKIGAITGATVTLASSSCQVEFIKSGEATVSSAFVQAADTPYVLATEQGAGTVLVKVVED